MHFLLQLKLLQIVHITHGTCVWGGGGGVKENNVCIILWYFENNLFHIYLQRDAMVLFAVLHNCTMYIVQCTYNMRYNAGPIYKMYCIENNTNLLNTNFSFSGWGQTKP